MEYLIIMFTKLIIILNYAASVLSEHDTEIIHVENNSESCKNNVCFPKCCNNNEYMDDHKNCIPRTRGQDFFAEIPVYGKNIRVQNTVGKLSKFHMKPGRFGDIFFHSNSVRLPRPFKKYLTEDGTLYLEIPNVQEDMRWNKVDPSKFCVDYIVKDNETAPFVEYWLLSDNDSTADNLTFYKTAQSLSCVCLFLVLLVYSAFPELRSIGGLIIMGYVSSLLVSFLLLIVIGTVIDPTVTVCRVTTILVYFSLLSSFCWTNVMSFDIWWTFSGYVNASGRHTRGKVCRFLTYSLYALGIPLLMTIGLGILDAIDSYVNIPGFIAPKILSNGGFLGGLQKMLYLYTPMLIMLMMNWTLFIITVVKLIRFHKGNSVLDQQSQRSAVHTHRALKNRLILYFKLSVVMGLTWVLEVISFQIPDDYQNFFYITDAYNMLSGVWIFIIFVCKRKIYIKIVKKFWRKGSNHQDSGRKRSFSQDSFSKTPLTVSSDPGMK